MPEVSGHDVGTAEALKQLSHLCRALEERVARLEAMKSDRTELEELSLPFLEGGGNPSGPTGGGDGGVGAQRSGLGSLG